MTTKYCFDEFKEELSEKPNASRIYYKIFSFAKEQVSLKRKLKTKLSIDRLCIRENIEENECAEIIKFLEKKEFVEVKKFKIGASIELTPQKIPECEKKYLDRYLKYRGGLKWITKKAL